MKYHLYLKTMTLFEVEASTPNQAAALARSSYKIDPPVPGIRTIGGTTYEVGMEPGFEEEAEAWPR